MRSPLLGLVGALIAFIGLFLSAGAHDGGMFFVGLVFFLFGVGLNFWLIARGTPSVHKGEGGGGMVAAE